MRTKDGEREQELDAQTVVGRHRRADLIIKSAYVSGIHAMIQWRSDGWRLKDLGSHNGTILNGSKLKTGQTRKLNEGDEVAFGDRSVTWVLVDGGAPEPKAVSEDGEVVVGVRGMLALPDASAPDVVLWPGAGGSWRLESEEGDRDAEDGEPVEAGNRIWTLSLPLVTERTRRGTGGGGPTELAQSTVRVLALGPKDARVVISDSDGNEREIDPGAAARLVMHLAQARASDGEGWVEREQLLDTLRVSANHMNVTVYRLRQQFAAEGFTDAPMIVARRGREIRLGGLSVSITNER